MSIKSIKQAACHLLVAAACVAGSSVNAQVILAQDDLPGEAQWYVHANVEGLRNSVGLAPFYAESLGEAFEDILKDTGVDLAGELAAVTAFGDGRGAESAAVVLHGLSADAQLAIIDALTEHTELIEMDYAGASYYQVSRLDDNNRGIGGDHEMVFAMGVDQTLLTTDLDLLQQFVDADMQMAGIGQSDSSALLVLKANQALVQGSLSPGSMNNGPFDSSLLENISQLAGVVSEDAAGISVYARVFTNDDATASYVHNILQGLVSLKALDSGSDPRVNELMNRLSITSNGPEVALDLTIPPALAAELADEL